MPAAADTAQPSDTTPPSLAAAGKGGKRGSGSKAPDPAAADQAAVAPADAAAEPAEDAELVDDAATEPGPPEPKPGWFRNTAKTPLTVIPDQYPAANLAPGEAAWLPDDPRHPNIERCEPPEPAAEPETADADTAGSEK